MELTKEIREEMEMAGNNKNSENKTGDDSTETKKSEKTISKKRSEPSSDKPITNDMKVTLPLSKSDEKYFQACHKKMTEFLKILEGEKKIRTFSHCASSNSRSR